MDDETRELFMLMASKALDQVDISTMELDHASQMGEHLGRLAWVMSLAAGKAAGEEVEAMGGVTDDDEEKN